MTSLKDFLFPLTCFLRGSDSLQRLFPYYKDTAHVAKCGGASSLYSSEVGGEVPDNSPGTPSHVTALHHILLLAAEHFTADMETMGSGTHTHTPVTIEGKYGQDIMKLKGLDILKFRK